jgi:hypothetical protein
MKARKLGRRAAAAVLHKWVKDCYANETEVVLRMASDSVSALYLGDMRRRSPTDFSITARGVVFLLGLSKFRGPFFLLLGARYETLLLGHPSDWPVKCIAISRSISREANLGDLPALGKWIH